jgi:hypothetical protein
MGDAVQSPLFLWLIKTHANEYRFLQKLFLSCAFLFGGRSLLAAREDFVLFCFATKRRVVHGTFERFLAN